MKSLASLVMNHPVMAARLSIFVVVLSGLGLFRLSVDSSIAVFADRPDSAAAALADIESRFPGFAELTILFDASDSDDAARAARELASTHGWYLTRQLGNFKSGRRGTHPDDIQGLQMPTRDRAISRIFSGRTLSGTCRTIVRRGSASG